MHANYRYSEPFGDILATVTGKSAARGRDSARNLRWERVHYIDRISDLHKEVRNLRRANAVMLAHACKEGERMLAEIARLRAELADMRDTAERCFAAAMKNAVALADERKGERGE